MALRLSKKYLKKALHVLVGVSGGADSVVLLHALRNQFPGLSVTVAHFNHLTRGAESERDAAFVKKLSREMGLKFIQGQRTGQGVSENALRRERVAFLKSTAHSISADLILLAHHQDDQIETLFLRLLRGTGLSGLGCMKEKNGLFVRPLLFTSKKSILMYAKKHHLSFCEDSSNQSPRYFRNRIRHELLPAFETLAKQHGGEGQTKRRLSQMLLELSQTDSYLQKETTETYREIVTETPFFLRLSLSDLKKIPPEVRPRFWRHLLKKTGMESPLRSDIARAEKWRKSGEKEIHLQGKISLQRSLGQLYLKGPAHQKMPLILTQTERSEMTRYENSVLGLSLSLKTDPSLEVRFFRAGDRLNSKKLKEVFLTRRIPHPERFLVPLLAKKNSPMILWVFPEKHELVHHASCQFPFSVK